MTADILRLRPVRADDLPLLQRETERVPDDDPFGFFGYRPPQEVVRRFADDGLLGPDAGWLMVTVAAEPVGHVGWLAVQHGPSPACRAYNIGIVLWPEHRGKGYGGLAQRALADHLFATTLVNRVEAGTDVDNVAEQRALAKAGFRRDGVLRGAQYRAGRWRDVLLYSRLRSDP